MIPPEKESSIFLLLSYFSKNQEAVLCHRGSVCQQWMTEMMWFLSILILAGAPFQKGQEWRSKKFSRECFITCLANMKQFNPLDCPWLRSKGCVWRAQDVARNTEQQDGASPQPWVCTSLSELLPPEQEDGWGLASGRARHISLSFFFPLCGEYFFAHWNFL